MILVQVLKVLPAGADFSIFDMNRPILTGHIARSDKSIMWPDIDSDIKYQKMYAGFHVELIDKVYDKWIINIR